MTTVCGTIGALAISSFPLTSGFVSKSMVRGGGRRPPAAGVAVAPGGLGRRLLARRHQFPWFVFFQKDSGLRPAEPPPSMRWAMILFAFLCIAMGVWLEPLYRCCPIR